MVSLRLAFFGTPSFALASLARLHSSSHKVVLVVTQPDRPKGRGQKLTAGPVKTFAVEHDLRLLQPARLKDDEFRRTIGELNLDLGVVAAYGKLLPDWLLDAPRLGMVNVHASLLPRWRGAAPIHRAVLAGDSETGITIMRVVAALDAGPALSQARTPIEPNETSAELESRLAEIGAAAILETVDALAAGPVPEQSQDETGVTYASRLVRADSQVDWTRSAREIHDQIRGLHPWPLAAVSFRGRRLLLLASLAEPTHIGGTPGTVVGVDAASFSVATGSGVVRIARVQVEGRPAVDARAFINGYHPAVGEQLDSVESL